MITKIRWWIRMLPVVGLTGLISATDAPIRLSADTARRTDISLCTTQPAVGNFLTGFEHDSSRADWTAKIREAGIYDVRLKYRSPSGKKLSRFAIGDFKFESPLAGSEPFRTVTVGRAQLTVGSAKVAIEKGDGWYDVAALELARSEIVAPPRPPGIPCDSDATPATKKLLQNLCDGVGKFTLTGGYGDADEKLVARLTGKRPAIFGADLMDFSPSRIEHGSHPPNVAADLITRYQNGQTVTLCWHWNAPSGLVDKVVTNPDGKTKDCRWYRGFYTDATTFDVESALADPASDSYRLLLRDIDAISVPLQQLSDAGVPVLWRPLHEAQGKWFWWGAKGPVPFKKLWRLTYDRLVRVHGLHNLIWVFTDDTAALSSQKGDPGWYPGDDMVDIVGIDAYPKNIGDVMAGHWIELSARYAGRKPFALTEFGGVPDVAGMYRLGCPWTYFVTWTGPEGPSKNPPGVVETIYADPHARSAFRPSLGTSSN